MKKQTITCIIAGVVVLVVGHFCQAQTPPTDAAQTTTTNLPSEPQVKPQQSSDVTGALSTSNSTTDIQGLPGDKVIVKASEFVIRQNELDKILIGARANAAAQGQTLPPEFQVAILNQLITIEVLLQTANAADRAAGAAESEEQYKNLVKRFGSTEAFERQLKAVGMTVDELRTQATQEAVAKAALKRGLNISASEDEAMAFFAKNIKDFVEPETASTPAKQYAYNDVLPQVNKTVAEICKNEVESEKIKNLAPDYVKNLRSKQQVEITDPALKALDETVRAQAKTSAATQAK